MSAIQSCHTCVGGFSAFGSGVQTGGVGGADADADGGGVLSANTKAGRSERRGLQLAENTTNNTVDDTCNSDYTEGKNERERMGSEGQINDGMMLLMIASVGRGRPPVDMGEMQSKSSLLLEVL